MTRATTLFAAAAAAAVASMCNGASFVNANCLDDQIDAADRETTMVICCDDATPKTIPADIGDLRGLKRIYLQQCSLTGTVPKSMTKLDDVTHIYLYDNKLEGELNPRFGDMESLKKLMLSINQFTGTIPAALASNDLQKLTLHDNLLSGGIPEAFENMEQLTWLTLSNNRIQKPMIKLPKLAKYWDFTSSSLYVLPGDSCAENPEQCLNAGTCSDKDICCKEDEVCAPHQYFWYEDVVEVAPDTFSSESIGITVAAVGTFIVGAGLVLQSRRRKIKTVPAPTGLENRDSSSGARTLSATKSMVSSNPAFKEGV